MIATRANQTLSLRRNRARWRFELEGRLPDRAALGRRAVDGQCRWGQSFGGIFRMARTQGAASPSLQAPRKQALFQGLMIASVPLRGAAANGARERIAAGQACRVGAELSTESRQRVQRVPEAACAAFRPRPSVFTPHGSGWFGGAFPLLWERTLFSPAPPTLRCGNPGALRAREGHLCKPLQSAPLPPILRKCARSVFLWVTAVTPSG